MKLYEFDYFSEVLANEDLQQLVRRGSILHDRAVFSALCKITEPIYKRCISFFTGGAKVKYQERQGLPCSR